MYKKLLVAAVFVTGTLTGAMAQTTGQNNLGFEDWSSPVTGSAPSGFVLLGGSENTSDPQEGGSAVHIETQNVQVIQDTAGLLLLGKVENQMIKQGEPWNGDELSRLEGWVRYEMMESTDTAYVLAQSSRYDAQNDTTMIVRSALTFLTGSESSWTQVSVPFQELAGGTADSINIFMTTTPSFIFQGYEGTETVGSYLDADGFSLKTAVGIEENVEGMKNYRVFPNPAKEKVTFRILDESARSVQLFDVTGKQVKSMDLVSKREKSMNIQELSEGMYIYQVRGENGELIHTDKISVVE